MNQDRERAEEVVRRRILFDSSKDGIVILGLDGAVRESNLSFSRMLGYAPLELLQLHVWD
jgi:PAS domain S-box-containing protein